MKNHTTVLPTFAPHARHAIAAALGVAAFVPVAGWAQTAHGAHPIPAAAAAASAAAPHAATPPRAAASAPSGTAATHGDHGAHGGHAGHGTAPTQSTPKPTAPQPGKPGMGNGPMNHGVMGHGAHGGAAGAVKPEGKAPMGHDAHRGAATDAAPAIDHGAMGHAARPAAAEPAKPGMSAMDHNAMGHGAHGSATGAAGTAAPAMNHGAHGAAANGAAPAMDHGAMGHGAQHGTPGTAMPAAPSAMDHGAMGHGASGVKAGAKAGAAPAMDHSAVGHGSAGGAAGGHDMAGMGKMQGGSAPPDARDPDAYSDGLAHGPMTGMDMADNDIYAFVLIDKLETAHSRRDSVKEIDAQAWFGRDINKLWLKLDAERSGGRLGSSRAEVLWNRAIAPYWGLQTGVRHDFGEGPERNWLAFGVQGLAPYWFHVDATAYVGPSGRTALRLEAEYELLLTQRLILQPDVKVSVYGRNDPAREIGSGLSSVDVGLRLRYEFKRKFAPYIGIVRSQKFGTTADYARADGKPAGDTKIVAGVRIWF